jgi:cytochrome P450
LSAARDDEDQPLADAELRDQLITLLLAGHETTAAALAWCFERLVRHPTALERLIGELEQDDGEDYLDAVINETLRVRPVIDQVVRKLSAPVTISGHVLPAGTIVAASIVGVQRSDVFDDPQRFRPERFLHQSPPPYALIPFGGGSHRCLGASFALMEIKAVLRAVLQRVALRAPSPRPERPTRLRRFATIPAKGARVIVTSRRASQLAS